VVKMKKILILVIICLGLLSLKCGGSSQSVKLGECPLTINVVAEGDGFDGFANVYIDGKFIGATDSRSQMLRVNLRKGEYTIIVVADGFKPWKGKILLLGKDYKQSALARLKKPEPEKNNPIK